MNESLTTHKQDSDLNEEVIIEARRHIREVYGQHIQPEKYSGELGTKMFFLCIIGFTMIPLEIFLKDILTQSFENPLIQSLQGSLMNGSSALELQSSKLKIANMILDLTEIDSLRYLMFILYLTGDAILATKTALVGFFGEFLLVLLKIAYKEPRPFWVYKDIKTFRCNNSSDFEGPSDHIFILMFMGTYLNLIYLRKYSA